MIVGAIFIPKNLADLLNLIRSQSSYLVPFKASPGYGHVVLVGNFEITTVRAFLTEFFCKARVLKLIKQDHGPITMRTRIVMLTHEDPDPNIETLLKNPFYQNRITYIKGNPLSFPAMAKAKLDTALACFIFLSYSEEIDMALQDSVMVMQALVRLNASKLITRHFESLTRISISTLKL